MLRHLGVDIPNPFQNVEFEPRPSLKNRSTFDIKKLAQAAIAELREDDSEACKVFFLAAGAGLRRSEIDALEWTAFLWSRGVIRIGPTKYFQPKSEHSIGDIDIDSFLLEIFKGYHATATSTFVIEAPGLPKPQARYVHYRCQEHFERLSAWLRARGVSTNKPLLHTLRKEFGSLICEAEGIYAASRALRHSNIGVTDAYYTDKRRRVTVGLDRLLSE